MHAKTLVAAIDTQDKSFLSHRPSGGIGWVETRLCLAVEHEDVGPI
ncbi:MAG: hypothetical protein QOG89_3588 [Thermomicrobiales bacterium]|nr:hypothetical protein [Thermomicrobiales bacterium]